MGAIRVTLPLLAGAGGSGVGGVRRLGGTWPSGKLRERTPLGVVMLVQRDRVA